MSGNPDDTVDGDSNQVNTPTRRKALRAIGATGVSSLVLQGVTAARGDDSSRGSISERESDWWAGDNLMASAANRDDVEVVDEGVTDWVSTNAEAPEWLTIHDNDELRYKPHGAFRTDDAELCLPTSVDVGPVSVGIEACHYGGCEWEVKACLAACIGTGMKDDCSGYHSLSGDIGVVNAELGIRPKGDLVGGVMFLTGMEISGELCYYYVIGSDCKTMNIDYGF